ncbi:MAG: acyltransferase [Solirubrobacterales bacterium]
MISADARLGSDVSVGQNVVVHAGSVIGDGCVLQDGCVIGKPAALSAATTAAISDLDGARLGAGTKICAGAIVFASAQLADGVVIGDNAIVRERVSVGAGSVIGAAAVVENDTTIGANVKIQTLANITAHVTIEDDVFVAPGVLTTNDNAIGRAPEEPNIGPTLRRGCRIGAGSVLLPGIEIGEQAFVAAGSLVTRSVAPGMLVMGSPAREIRAIDAP